MNFWSRKICSSGSKIKKKKKSEPVYQDHTAKNHIIIQQTAYQIQR